MQSVALHSRESDSADGICCQHGGKGGGEMGCVALYSHMPTLRMVCCQVGGVKIQGGGGGGAFAHERATLRTACCLAWAIVPFPSPSTRILMSCRMLDCVWGFAGRGYWGMKDGR